MRFKKIRIKNIRSYKEEEIIFPEGSLLLSGEIGSGKTTILLALEYAMFGLQPGQKGNSLLRNAAKLGEVDLELEIGGELVKIERKLKRTPRGISNEYASITLNNEKIESSITEIKSKVVSLLGYPAEFVKKNNIIYKYTVYTPQEQMKQIILEDPETRLNLLRHIFGIDKYKRVKDNIDIWLSSLKSESKLLQLEISDLNKDMEELTIKKEGLERIKEKILLNEENITEKIQTRKAKEQEIEETNKKIEERRIFKEEVEKTKILLIARKENLVSLYKEEDELNRLIKETKETFNETLYNDLINVIANKKEKIEKLTNEYAEVSGKLNSLEQERNSVLSKKERIFQIDICPTCLQDVPENHKHNILNETENRLSEISKHYSFFEIKFMQISQELAKQKADIQKLEEENFRMRILQSKQEQITRAKSKILEVDKQKRAIERDLEILTKHIGGLKERIAEYAAFETQLKKKEEELKNAFKDEKNSEIFLAEIKKESEFAKKEILALEERIKQKESLKQRLSEINELNDWLSSKFSSLVELVERNVLLRLRAEFSILFKKWFLMLVNEGPLETQIDDSFTPIVLQGEAEMDYDFLSGGERTAVALAYRLALNQTINSLLSKIRTRGIIILDEPTDGFSESQIERMRDILDELNAEQLIIVSHEQKIESFVDNVLKVFKEGNSSRIEYQHSPIVAEAQEVTEAQENQEPQEEQETNQEANQELPE